MIVRSQYWIKGTIQFLLIYLRYYHRMPTHSFLTLIKRNIPHTVTHWYHTIHLLWVRLRGNFNSSHVRPFSYSHLNYFLLFQVKWFIHLCKFSDLWKKKRTFMGQVSYDFNENLKQKMKMFVCSDRRVLSSPYENFRVGIRSKQELHLFCFKTFSDWFTKLSLSPWVWFFDTQSKHALSSSEGCQKWLWNTIIFI